MRPTLRRTAGAIAAPALAAALLVGCGSSSKKSASAPGSNGTTATTKPNLAGVTLAVDAEWSGDEQAAFQQVLAKFEQETGAKITYTSTGDDVAAVLGTAIQGGKPPDVALLPQPGLMKELAGKGSLVPVDDIVGKDVDANFAPVWRQLGSVDGKLFGVWFKAANKSTVWYNTKTFKDAGIQPPKTFDDLVKDAKTISDSGVTPISQGAADGWTLTDWFENIYLRQAGTDKYDQLSTHAIPWTDPSVKKALTTMGQILAPNLLVGGTAGALQTDFPTSVTNVFATPPKGAIVYEGDFVATNIKKETQAKLGIDADFFDFPSVDGSKPAVVGGGDVAVLMKDSPGGRALMQYLASPESADIWAKLGGFTSPNKKVDLSVYPDDITRRTAQAITTTSNFRFDMSDLAPAAFGGTVGKGEWKILQDWLTHEDQVDQTTQQLEDAAKAAFGH